MASAEREVKGLELIVLGEIAVDRGLQVQMSGTPRLSRLG